VLDQVDSRVKAAIFDLDGTLVDSAPDIRAAANTVLAAQGLEGLTLEETRGFIGAGAPVFVERMAAARLAAPDPSRNAAMLAHFLDLYEGAVGLTRLYPGVAETLETLAAEGWRLGLCTNKPEGPARAVLRHFDLARFFPVVVGGDTLPQRKPDPMPLSHVVAALAASRPVYVGDSETDAATALAARIPFALFTEGYRHTPAEALPHDWAFADFALLPDWLRARA
jgi:phosphoglycolate phosphatase